MARRKIVQIGFSDWSEIFELKWISEMTIELKIEIKQTL